MSLKKLHAFSLVEVMVTLSIMAVLAALIFGRLGALRTESIAQVARDQVAAVQRAVHAWLAAQSSVQAAVDAYNGGGATVTDLPMARFDASVRPYLDAAFLDAADIQPAVGNNGYTTEAMREIVGTNFAAVSVNINGANVNIAPVANATSAHFRIYYHAVANATATATLRRVTQPIVVLFIPTS